MWLVYLDIHKTNCLWFYVGNFV